MSLSFQQKKKKLTAHDIFKILSKLRVNSESNYIQMFESTRYLVFSALKLFGKRTDRLIEVKIFLVMKETHIWL